MRISDIKIASNFTSLSFAAARPKPKAAAESGLLNGVHAVLHGNVTGPASFWPGKHAHVSLNMAATENWAL